MNISRAVPILMLMRRNDMRLKKPNIRVIAIAGILVVAIVLVLLIAYIATKNIALI